MVRSHKLVEGSFVAVALALFANWIFLVAVVVGFALSFLFAADFAAMLAPSRSGQDLSSLMTGMRWLMVVGIVMAAAIVPLLRSLANIIGSVADGDPFIAANAQRLQTIGWALLVLQLLDLACILIDHRFPSLGSAAPDGAVSVGGWLAVLMAFVLSRVFAAGSAMRDDLAGTV